MFCSSVNVSTESSIFCLSFQLNIQPLLEHESAMRARDLISFFSPPRRTRPCFFVSLYWRVVLHLAVLFRIFFRAMLCKRGLSCRAVSVCPSVTFVDFVKTNKHIFKKFSYSGSPIILVFRTKRNGNIPAATPLTGASNAGGVGINRDSEPISRFTACCEPFHQQVQYT